MAATSHGLLTAEQKATLVKARALELGFDACGITDLTPPPHAESLDRWIAEGMAGTMRYMHRQATKRKEPARIVSGATRAVVLTRYYQSTDTGVEPGAGRVARYARGKDYHEALREPLANLTEYVKSLGATDAVARWYVDAGPVPERELAQRAGLGWIGKNTMLIDPARGSYSFIAAVLTDVDLATDLPFEADRCGTCRRCLDACPTGAFPGERVLDANLCISYLTIEFKGEVESTLATGMGDWVFGCDDCQAVCPWNEKFASDTGALKGKPEFAGLRLDWLAGISDEEFQERLGETPLTRPGAAVIRRNARIGLANAGRGDSGREGLGADGVDHNPVG
jgi:epoxyqueuosine reductase